MKKVKTCKNPLALDAVAGMIDKRKNIIAFRHYAKVAATLMIAEIAKDFQLEDVLLKTRLNTITTREKLAKKVKKIFIPILRAGISFEEPLKYFLPDATICHFGARRRHEDHRKVDIYSSSIIRAKGADYFVLDPMGAYGTSSKEGIRAAYEAGAGKVTFVCLFISKEAADAIWEEFPDVDIHCILANEGLNDNGYLLYCCGDFGDEYNGTPDAKKMVSKKKKAK